MSRLVLTQNELSRATAIVRRHVPATPQICWPLLTEAVGAEVWVKHENHTPVGAFKVRGGLVYVERMVRERPQTTGLVSATRGNHGQSLAFSGRVARRRVTIVVPHGNSADKNASMRALGAEVVVAGHDFQAARERSVEIAQERGWEVVSPYHPDLVLGVSTYAAELFDAVTDLDTIYVPVGMGSGISGLIAVRDLFGRQTEIVGVVSSGAPATALSFAQRACVDTVSANTFVDGVATRSPDPVAIEVILAGAARVLTVSDDEAAEAMRLMFRATHNAAEPAGALALAGLLSEREVQQGRRVAVIHTGGNLDAAMLAAVLTGHTPVA